MKLADIPIPIQGAVTLVLAAMLYGMFGIISRIVGYNLPLFYQSFMRVCIASALLVWTYKSWIRLPIRDWGWVLLRAIAGLIAFLLFFIAVNAMEVNITYFIFYGGSTIGGFLLGAFLFREQTTSLRIFSLGLAGLGLALVYNVSGSSQTSLFALLAFISGVCTATWNATSKKVARYPTAQLAFLDNALSLPVHMGISLYLHEPWPLFELSLAQGANVLLGILFVVTGILMVYGFRRLDVQIGSLVMLSEILFAIAFGFLFYHELPALRAIFGGMLILIAMILPELNWKTMRTKHYANRRKTDR